MIDLAATIAKLKPGSAYDVPAGTYAGDIRILVPNLTLRAAGTVRIKAGRHFGCKIEADGVSLIGLDCSDNDGYGVMVARADGGEVHETLLEQITADRCGISGILTSNAHGFTARDCRGRKTRGQHGIYISQRASAVRILGGEYTGCARGGAQANGHPGGITDLVIQGADCRGNANFGLQLAAVKGAIIAGNQVSGNRQSIVVWDDQGGAAAACSDVDLTGQDGKVKVHPLCTNIRTKPGALVKWSD